MDESSKSPEKGPASSRSDSSVLGQGLAIALEQLRETTKPSLASLQGLWRGRDRQEWSGSPEIYRLLGQRILKLGEPLLAYDVVAEGIKVLPQDVPLRQLLALALARSGAAGPANAVLVKLYEEGHRDEETLGLLARTHKDLANEAADAAEAERQLRRAFEFYTQAYRTTGGYWSGINAATLALVLGERDRARGLASEVTERCRQLLKPPEASDADRYWLLSTLGEAALVRGYWDEAEDWYSQALEVGRGDWGSLQSTRRNARLIVQHAGGDPERLERLFRFPSVVVFTGHMVDAPGRGAPRFPPRLEPAVNEAIRERLKKLNAGFGYASAACGSDILFHEVMLEMKGEIHIVLPFDRQSFVNSSVDIIPGSDWGKRYDRVIVQASDIQEASQQSRAASGLAYEFSNLLLHGLASIRAEQLGTRLAPLAVWDGQPGDGPGGTAATVEHWKHRGLPIEIIDLAEILRRAGFVPGAGTASVAEADSAGSGEAAEFASEIRALLFADAEGFSKLTDEEVPRFVRHFLGLVGEVAGRLPLQPLMKNTWGDGLYFVFPGVKEAGEFALDLRDRVRNVDWTQKGLPALDLRIGLHAGPVYACTDPVTQRVNYIGAHVSRAARIEPITPTGQVYASQAFAALSAAEGVREFRCDYVGQTPMAKGYGTYPTYVVLRRPLARRG